MPREEGCRGALEGQEGGGNNCLGNVFLYLSQTPGDLKERSGKQFRQDVGLKFGRHTIYLEGLKSLFLVSKLPRDINSTRNIQKIVLTVAYAGNWIKKSMEVEKLI